MADHKTIADAELHQPKGVASATDGQIMHASSSAASWEFEKAYLTLELDDLSTASSTWLPAPFTGRVNKIKTILHGAITTANATVTMEINGSAVTGSSITVTQSGSAAGDVDTATPSAANTFNENDQLEIITDGASDTATRLTIVLELKRTS